MTVVVVATAYPAPGHAAEVRAAAAEALADLRGELGGLTTGDLDIQVLAPVAAGTPAQGAL